jgi:hypothetical protein
MTDNFEWEAEDGTTFDEEDVREGFHARSRPGFRRPVLLLIAIALLVLSGVLAFRQLGQRVANTTGAVEEAINSSHTLIVSAARSGDVELLANVLSGRQSEWTDSQLDLLREDLFYDRRPLGLEWQSAESVEPIEISVSPDLQEAEVISLQSYLLQGDPTAHVNFEQTSIYRRSGDRWLLSPPTFDFWGNKVSTRGRFLELNVLKRDESLGLRIAADLEATIGSTCASLRNLECQPDTYVQVNLLADPTLLVEMEPLESRLRGGQYLNLPTPTLVGIPVDEPGFRALYRGYAERVVSSLIGDLVDWSCCRRAHFYSALLDAQLFQLGIKRWPVTDEDYRQLSDRSIGLDQVRELWSQDEDIAEVFSEFDTRIIYAFVEYLTSDVDGVSAAAMQRSLTSSATLDDWLAQIVADGTAIDQEWNRFVRARIGDSAFGD